MVERSEVVVLVFDLGAFEHREPETNADILHPPPNLGDEMQVTGRLGRIAGQRHIQSVLAQALVQLGRLELGRAALEQALQRLAHAVGLLAHRPALLGRQLADRAQRGGQLGLAPEVAHAQLLELGGRTGRADGVLGLGLELLQLRHRRASYAPLRRAPRWPPWPR